MFFCNWLIDGSFNMFNTNFCHTFNLAQILKTCWCHINLLSIKCFLKGHYGCRKYLWSGLISLVVATSCTIDGVVGALLLVPIFTNMKLGGSYLKIKKSGLICMQLKFINMFVKVAWFHVFLYVFFYELYNGLPPFLPFKVFVSQGLILHLEQGVV